VKPEAQSQGEARGSKPVTDKKKGKNSEGASKEESKPGIKIGGKETGTRSEEEPKEWWPSAGSRKGHPTPTPAWEQRTRVIQTQIQPEIQERKRK
jgi:hypothetical protein